MENGSKTIQKSGEIGQVGFQNASVAGMFGRTQPRVIGTKGFHRDGDWCRIG
jgi:hypothetical protein